MGKLFSSMGGLMRGDILFIPCDGEGCERLIPGTPTRAMRHYRLSTKYRGLLGAGGDGTPDQTDAKKKAPEVTPVGFRDINFNTKKEGGHLLSRIALQYHRRSRA